MKRCAFAVFLIALPLAGLGQDPKAGNPDEAVWKQLDSMMMSLDFNEASLEFVVGFCGECASPTLAFFIDPVEVAHPGKSTIEAKASKLTLNEALKVMLKPAGLEHLVFQGSVIVTTAKGAQAFQSPGWIGFDRTAAEKNKDLAGKLARMIDGSWSLWDAAKAVEDLAKASGAAIDASKLKGLAPLEPRKGFKTPARTTLFGALVFLSRTTGVTFALTTDGGLVANPPAKPAQSK